MNHPVTHPNPTKDASASASELPNVLQDLLRQITFVDVAFLVSLLSLGPMLWLQGNSLWSKAHFQFFPLAWGAFGYFISLRLKQLSTTTSLVRYWIGFMGAVLSLVIAAEAVYISSPWLSQVAGIGLVVSWLLLRAGSLRWQNALAPTSLLFMTLPFPAGYDAKMIHFLQAQSSLAASTVLDCIGILHLPSGNILELSHKRLFVDEACSGVDSLYALMAICLSIVLWFRQRFFVAVLSLSLVPIWASCGNIARLVSIVLGLEWVRIDLSDGIPHMILGLIVFACAFGCDYAFIRFIGALFGERVSTPAIQSSSQAKARFQRIFGTAMASALLICFGALGAYSTKILATGSMLKYPSFTEQQIAEVRRLQSLPNRMLGWQLDSFHATERSRESTIGQYSHTWQYNLPNGSAIISTDFPFRGFHLLDICYEGAGWQLTSPSKQGELSLNSKSSSEPKVYYPHILEMENDDGRFGMVAYSLFRLDGTPIQSKAKAIRGAERFEQTMVEPISFQIQIFLSSMEPITDREKQELLANLSTVVGSFESSFQHLQDN